MVTVTVSGSPICSSVAEVVMAIWASKARVVLGVGVTVASDLPSMSLGPKMMTVTARVATQIKVTIMAVHPTQRGRERFGAVGAGRGGDGVHGWVEVGGIRGSGDGGVV